MIYLLIGICIFIVLGIVIANTAPSEFINNYYKYKNMGISCMAKVTDFVDFLINNNLFEKVKISLTDDELKDAYYSKSNRIVLSKKTISNSSIASFGTIAHEFGHAEQNLTNDSLYVKTQKLRVLSKFLGALTLPIIIVGTLLLLFLEKNLFIAYILLAIGALCFLIICFCNYLVTKVEFDASTRAIKLLQKFEFLTDDEIKQIKIFLKKAGYTYLGNFFSTLLYWTFLVPKPKII